MWIYHDSWTKIIDHHSFFGTHESAVNMIPVFKSLCDFLGDESIHGDSRGETNTIRIGRVGQLPNYLSWVNGIFSYISLELSSTNHQKGNQHGARPPCCFQAIFRNNVVSLQTLFSSSWFFSHLNILNISRTSLCSWQVEDHASESDLSHCFKQVTQQQHYRNVAAETPSNVAASLWQSSSIPSKYKLTDLTASFM
jgi:hypothetical protein